MKKMMDLKWIGTIFSARILSSWRLRFVENISRFHVKGMFFNFKLFGAQEGEKAL